MMFVISITPVRACDWDIFSKVIRYELPSCESLRLGNLSIWETIMYGLVILAPAIEAGLEIVFAK